MTDIFTPAISAENLEKLREKAESITDLNHMVPDARDTRNVPADVVEAMNAMGDRYGVTDWTSTGDERVRVMSAWCALLPHIHMVPSVHEPDQADWHWSGVRCFLAGAGYDAHAALATQLTLVYPQCPLRPDETEPEWTKALAEAHQRSGIPACIANIPWSALLGLPAVDKDALDDMGVNWITGAALLHVLKHVRTYQDEVRVMYRGTAAFYRRDASTNVVNAQPRLMVGLMTSLRMERMDGRKKEFDLADVGATRCMKGLTFTSLLEVAPLTRAPGMLIVGQFTTLVPDPGADGWFQHGLRLTQAWAAGNEVTRPFSGNDETIMGYAWTLEQLDETQRLAYTLLAEAVPPTFVVDSPFTILRQYQPNFVTDWAGDDDAYESIIDAMLCVSVMRDRVTAARREFPVLWLLPDEPTQKGSTNQGKTTAVGALAGCMTPGIMVSRPPDSNSAPDMRMVAGMIKTVGTVALDEWAMPKTQAHPLSARNLQSLATGGVAALGEVMENNPSPTILRQPIVASAKCVTLPEDVRNRSFFLFQRSLTLEERQQVNRYTAMMSGEVSLRMRLAALGLVQRFQLDQTKPIASADLRFVLHLAVATRLCALRTGKTGPEGLLDAQGRVEAVLRKMEARLVRHNHDADESGLASEMDSGESIQVRASDIFGGMHQGDLTKLADLLKQDALSGIVTAGQLLRVCARSDENAKTIRGLLVAITGQAPRANDRAICQSFARDLQRRMPEVGDAWPLPEAAGLDGWHLKRSADGSGGTLRVTLRCTHPTAPAFA